MQEILQQVAQGLSGLAIAQGSILGLSHDRRLGLLLGQIQLLFAHINHLVTSGTSELQGCV
jgi:DUF1365 family protein